MRAAVFALLLPAIAGAEEPWRAGAFVGAEYKPNIAMNLTNRVGVHEFAPSVSAQLFRQLTEAWEVGVVGSWTRHQGNGSMFGGTDGPELVWDDSFRLGGAARFSSPFFDEHRIFAQLALQYAPTQLSWRSGIGVSLSTGTYHSVAAALGAGALFAVLPWLRLRVTLEGFVGFLTLGCTLWGGAEFLF